MLYIYDGNSEDYGHLSGLFEQTISIMQGCAAVSPYTVPCGASYTDACGVACAGIGQGCSDPAAPYCVYIDQDYGYGGYYCVDWHP
jgi:hypothetical protein